MKIETNLGGPAFGAIELDAGTGRVKNGSVLNAKLRSEDYNTSKYEHLATSGFHRPNNKSKKPANSKPSWVMLYYSTRLNEFRFSLGHLTPVSNK